MPQVDKNFTAFWMDTTTAPGTPLTGLSATITIREVDAGTIVVNAEAMTNLGGGWYKYIFTAMASDKDYVYICNPGATAYIESGVTDKRLNSIDANISEIAVGWNPYVQSMTGIKGGIQKIVEKVEEKGNEVKKEVKEARKDIRAIEIPEQKEPIVNVTTQKIDTGEFIAEIKKIKPEVNVTTKNVDFSPILTAIKEIPTPSIPEQKEPDFTSIEQTINDAKEEIMDGFKGKIDLYSAVGGLFENLINKKEEDNEKRETVTQEEENLKKPFPNQFTARLK